jgi:hypothetical protein
MIQEGTKTRHNPLGRSTAAATTPSSDLHLHQHLPPSKKEEKQAWDKEAKTSISINVINIYELVIDSSIHHVVIQMDPYVIT